MRPSLRSIIPLRTRCDTTNVPRMLIAKTLSHSATVVSMKGVGELMPARLARATIGGNDSSISVMARSTDASSETSAPTPIAFTARLDPISAAAAFASSALMSRIAMDQPSLAMRSAAARPMPRADAAPVSTTVRSAGKGVIELIAGIPSGGSGMGL
jgi:hypothetical protein